MLTPAEYDLLVQYRLSRPAPTAPEKRLFEMFIEQKLVSIAEIFFEKGIPKHTWSVTASGEHELVMYEEKVKQHTANERQKRFENKIAVLNILILLITFIAGMIADHFSGIVGRLLSLFH